MFKVIGGLVVYGFALYGLGEYLRHTECVRPQTEAAEGSAG